MIKSKVELVIDHISIQNIRDTCNNFSEGRGRNASNFDTALAVISELKANRIRTEGYINYYPSAVDGSSGLSDVIQNMYQRILLNPTYINAILNIPGV